MKVAFVGGGCGTCTSSFYLDKLMAEKNIDTDITIFESSSNMGGRLQQVKVTDDVIVDLGGSIYHTGVNPTVVKVREDYMEKMKNNANTNKIVETINIYDDVESLGVWDGKQFVYRGPTKLYFVSIIQKILIDTFKDFLYLGTILSFFNKKLHQLMIIISMVFTYGFGSILGIKKFKDKEGGDNVIKLFLDFNNVDYYTAFGKYMPVHLVHINAKNILSKYGVSDKFINEVLEPVTRNIYSQNLDRYHSMAMLTTVLSGDSSKLRTFKKGNGAFFEEVAKSIEKCTIKRNTKVTFIEKVHDGKYQVTSKGPSGQSSTQVFDVVVLGAPFEKLNVEIKNVPDAHQLLSKIPKRDFVPVCLAVVSGVPNHKYFKCENVGSVPLVIRTTKVADVNNCPFLTFQALWFDVKNNCRIYKVQSKERLTREELDSLFSEKHFVYQHDFEYGYPLLEALEEGHRLPAKLSENLYYINSVESLSSAMEASAWSGRNIANLIADDSTIQKQSSQ
ncbi:prenylcysteine oxidase / farnesylcysteine lyase [Acrasis kona]|uniref:Prenylcysteine oxidase / farnesylcysteine lyase n=1 Tax=Acrasis kona TaxID=1008807 RepID=A0AAW2Z8D7_9EUKA